MYMTCLKTLQTREDNFTALTAALPAECIAEWEKIDVTPRKGKNREVISIYEPYFGKEGALNSIYVPNPGIQLSSRSSDSREEIT